MDQLRADPEATADGNDHQAREVMSGHFVPVKPTPLPQPAYISHSRSLFHELGLKDDLAQDPEARISCTREAQVDADTLQLSTAEQSLQHVAGSEVLLAPAVGE